MGESFDEVDQIRSGFITEKANIFQERMDCQLLLLLHFLQATTFSFFGKKVGKMTVSSHPRQVDTSKKPKENGSCSHFVYLFVS